jgi:hypothetical protein
MLALQRFGGKDADAVGLLDTEQDATYFPLTTRQGAARLDFPPNLFEHLSGTFHQEGTLRNAPNPEVGGRVV